MRNLYGENREMPSIKATLINSNPQEITADDWESICNDLFDIVIENSPVDTGAFQDAWELTMISDDIYEISNESEYASFLEDGWSNQAPNGVLGPAIQLLPRLIAQQIGGRPTGEVVVSMEIPEYVPKGAQD